MSKIKIGAQVTAKVRPTKVTVSGTFQGYRLEAQEDPTSICGTVLHVKDGMQHLDYVYVDSIKVCESEDERIRTALLRCCDDWEKGQFGCMAKEDVPAIRAYLEKQKEQKPAEWSEEDEDMLNSIIATCQLVAQDRDSGPARHLLERQEKFLKSLRSRPKSSDNWKPSKKQIDALWSATEKYLGSNNEKVREIIGKVLESLYNDLKNLI